MGGWSSYGPRAVENPTSLAASELELSQTRLGMEGESPASGQLSPNQRSGNPPHRIRMW